MQFTAAAFAAIALALGANAAAGNNAARQSGSDITILGQVRTYGQPGCSAENQGIYPVYSNQNNQCWTFQETVLSVDLEEIANGCNFYVYSEGSCQGTRVAFSAGACDNTVENISSWGSFMINCPTSAAGN